MNLLRNRIARLPIVAIGAVAWLAISNHCVLAVAIAQKAPEKSECPFHSHPSKPEKQKDSGAQPCCKILRAVVPTLAKTATRAIVDLVPVNLVFASFVVLAPPKIFFSFVTLDTGPPGTTSFAELIGSIRAHAPPFRV